MLQSSASARPGRTDVSDQRCVFIVGYLSGIYNICCFKDENKKSTHGLPGSGSCARRTDFHVQTVTFFVTG